MLKALPREIQVLVRSGATVFSWKARRRIVELGLSKREVEESVLQGSVYKRERDETGHADWKYTIKGRTDAGQGLYTCGKIISKEDRRYFFITIEDLEG